MSEPTIDTDGTVAYALYVQDTGMPDCWATETEGVRAWYRDMAAAAVQALTSPPVGCRAVDVERVASECDQRAAWCLLGAPNEWMHGEAKGNRDSAAAIRRALLAPTQSGSTQP